MNAETTAVPKDLRQTADRYLLPERGGSGTPILLTLDEYEVIRLVDLEQRTHEQCAAQMDISRSTVQEISTKAPGRRSQRVLSTESRCASPAGITVSAAVRSIRTAAAAAGCGHSTNPITNKKENLI